MANTKVTKAVLADDAVGLAQLDITNDPSDGQALTAEAVSDGYNLTWASVGVSGISSSADATAITITSDENVGIGTTSPNAYSNVTTLTINGTNQGRLDVEYGGTHGGSFLAVSGETQLKAVGSSQVMTFEVNNAERMRINSNGNVGIGGSPVSTTSGYDGASLHVRQSGTGSSVGSQVRLSSGSSGHAAGDGSYISHWGDSNLYIANQENANIKFYVNNNQRYNIASGGKHTFYGTHQGDNVGHFLFTNNGFDNSSVNCSLVVQNSHSFVQFMAWAHLGCRIGTRTSGWSTTGNQTTHLVSADTTFIYGSSNGTAYLGSGTAITSDERLKKNIVSTPDGQLAKINALRPVSFDWKDERKDSGEGFIAQEVEQVIPEAIAESTFAPDPDDDSRDFEGDVKSIKDSVLLSRLVKAVQELSDENDALKARIETLESN